MQRESIYEKITNADLQRFSDNNNIFISEYHIKYGFKNTQVEDNSKYGTVRKRMEKVMINKHVHSDPAKEGFRWVLSSCFSHNNSSNFMAGNDRWRAPKIGVMEIRTADGGRLDLHYDLAGPWSRIGDILDLKRLLTGPNHRFHVFVPVIAA